MSGRAELTETKAKTLDLEGQFLQSCKYNQFYIPMCVAVFATLMSFSNIHYSQTGALTRKCPLILSKVKGSRICIMSLRKNDEILQSLSLCKISCPHYDNKKPGSSIPKLLYLHRKTNDRR